MKRLTIAALTLCVGLATATGCSGGNEVNCKKAIENILRLTELDKTDSGTDVNKWVRSCRANASNEAIDCMIEAKTRDDLAKCEGGVAEDIDNSESTAEENKGE